MKGIMADNTLKNVKTFCLVPRRNERKEGHRQKHGHSQKHGSFVLDQFQKLKDQIPSGSARPTVCYMMEIKDLQVGRALSAIARVTNMPSYSMNVRLKGVGH
jgi:hypothetical protein